ncbi:MAG: glycosyltransferase [Candidatus Micrarchaeota archaeon]
MLAEKSRKMSVILPTLNEEKNIRSTLRELRKILPHAQLIVADGGSSDKTQEIAKKYADKLCLENTRKKKRPSIGAGRNAGAGHSRREWLVFCDADNVPPKSFFEHTAREFEKPFVVGFGGKVMPKHATFLQKWVFEIFNLIVHVSALVGRPAIAGNAVAYKKKPFNYVGGFDEEREASEDQELCQRMAKVGKVIYDKSVVTYTSNRRLKKFGLLGLLWDWGKTTLNFILGIKTKRYAIIREI